jgi:hypothetical protein
MPVMETILGTLLLTPFSACVFIAGICLLCVAYYTYTKHGFRIIGSLVGSLGLLFVAAGGGLGIPVALNNQQLGWLSTSQTLPVWRLGFSAPGDSGQPLLYIGSNSPCSLNSGNGDNGSQVKAPDGCWLASFGLTQTDVRIWGGCISAADSTPAFSAALAAVNTVYIPPSSTCNISSPIPFSGNAKQLVGINRGTSVITPTVNMAAVIDWGGTSARSSIRNLTINDPAHHSTSAIHYHNSVGNNFSDITDVDIIGPTTNAILVDSNAGADALNIRGLFTNNVPHSLNVGDSDLNGSLSDFYFFDGNIVLNQTTVVHNEGIRIYDGTILNRNTDQPGVQILAGLQITINNVIIDQNNNNCILLDSTNFSISGVRVRDSWCGPAIGAVGPNVDGIVLKAPSGAATINDVVFDGNRIQDFTGWGIKSTSFNASLIQDVTFTNNFSQGNTSGDMQLNNGGRYLLTGNRFVSGSASLVETASPVGTTIIGGYFAVNPSLAVGTQVFGTNFLNSVFYTYSFGFTNGGSLNPTTNAGCGTSPAFATGSNDIAGNFVAGVGSTTCQLGFRTPKPQAPVCSAHDDITGAALPVLGTSTTGFNIGSVVAGNRIFYSCFGYQ